MKDLNHHAYAFEGDKAGIVSDLIKYLKKDFNFEVKNNPDFYYQEFETFSIDDARELQDRHGRRAINGKKVFIITTRFITTEAQNALLKIFEEPSQGTQFFLIMPNTQVLLPTLLSRIILVKGDSGVSEEIEALVKKFISATLAERINLVKPIVEEKDKGKAIDFVSALEKVLAPSRDVGALTEVLLVKKFLHDRAPSLKLLLEHLCLSVTITKL